MPCAAAWRHRCTPTGGVEMAVAVGVPSRAGGSFGAWLRPWHIVLFFVVTGELRGSDVVWRHAVSDEESLVLLAGVV